MTVSAKVLLDSLSPWGDRLTTLEVVMHRLVLAEFNTHRAFSRNSASSRAIPFEKQLERVMNHPAIPLSFPAEQSGMQGGEELAPSDRRSAEDQWLLARDSAVVRAKVLSHLGVHKSVVNRLLEPFMWHTVIVTATEWDGFWAQRCSPLAQPEIRAAAEAMKLAYEGSMSTPVDFGEWHLPLIQEDEHESLTLLQKKQISAARCARVSYLTHEGTRSHEADFLLYDRLVAATPRHASPLEHVATPLAGGLRTETTRGNFAGWLQFRHQIEDEKGLGY